MAKKRPVKKTAGGRIVLRTGEALVEAEEPPRSSLPLLLAERAGWLSIVATADLFPEVPPRSSADTD